MKKYRLSTLALCVLQFGSGSLWAQNQPPLNADEEKAILGALIDRDAYRAQVRELETQLRIVDEQLRLADERLRIERDMRLGEKKLHLAALKALAEYRTVRRARFWKIVTFGIVRDKTDKILEAQILELETQIVNWK